MNKENEGAHLDQGELKPNLHKIKDCPDTTCKFYDEPFSTEHCYKCGWVEGTAFITKKFPRKRFKNTRASDKAVEALKEYSKRGHHDTCSHALNCVYDCSCGYDKAKQALAELEGGW